MSVARHAHILHVPCDKFIAVHSMPLLQLSHDGGGVQVDQLVFKELVDVRFPRLSAHLEGHGVNVSSVSTNWFLCIFVNSLPLESCLRVWDIFFLECCSSVLFRVALALVDIYSQVMPCQCTSCLTGD